MHMRVGAAIAVAAVGIIGDAVYFYEQHDPTQRGVTANNLIVVTSDGVIVADGQGTVPNITRLVADIAAPLSGRRRRARISRITRRGGAAPRMPRAR